MRPGSVGPVCTLESRSRSSNSASAPIRGSAEAITAGRMLIELPSRPLLVKELPLPTLIEDSCEVTTAGSACGASSGAAIGAFVVPVAPASVVIACAETVTVRPEPALGAIATPGAPECQLLARRWAAAASVAPPARREATRVTVSRTAPEEIERAPMAGSTPSPLIRQPAGQIAERPPW